MRQLYIKWNVRNAIHGRSSLRCTPAHRPRARLRSRHTHPPECRILDVPDVVSSSNATKIAKLSDATEDGRCLRLADGTQHGLVGSRRHTREADGSHGQGSPRSRRSPVGRTHLAITVKLVHGSHTGDLWPGRARS